MYDYKENLEKMRHISPVESQRTTRIPTQVTETYEDPNKDLYHVVGDMNVVRLRYQSNH
jgi:hypothetical protein